MKPRPAAADSMFSLSLEMIFGSAPRSRSSFTSSRSPAKAARISAVAKTMRREPSRMRARGVLLTNAFGVVPASSILRMTGSGPSVTIDRVEQRREQLRVRHVDVRLVVDEEGRHLVISVEDGQGERRLAVARRRVDVGARAHEEA